MGSLLQTINDDMKEYNEFLRYYDIKPITDNIYDDKLYFMYSNVYWNVKHNPIFKEYDISEDAFYKHICRYYENISGNVDYYKNLQYHIDTFTNMIKNIYDKNNI